MCIYLNNILASMYTFNYFNNNFILATICTSCEAPESNTIDSGAIQINCIIIIYYYGINGMINLFVLLYAVDTVIMAKHLRDMHTNLDLLNEYCICNKLKVNII